MNKDEDMLMEYKCNQAHVHKSLRKKKQKKKHFMITFNMSLTITIKPS